MSRGKTIVVVLLLVIGSVAAYYHYLTPEARVKRFLFRTRDAIEAQNLPVIEGVLADDFRDSFGFGKERWLPIIRGSLSQWKDIKLRFLELEVAVDGNQATARFQANGEATRSSSLGTENLPDRQSYTFRNITLKLARLDGKWQVIGWSNINSETWQVPMPEVNP